jgi:ankyrin repeat protein
MRYAAERSRREPGRHWLALLLVPALAGPAHAADTRVVDAAKAGHHAVLRDLVQRKADVNVAAPDGTTALHWAVQRDDVESVELLIRAGADVRAVNRYGVAPLILACINGSTPLVEKLLEAGADPNTALPEGETALMTASRTGAEGPVSLLLERGAKVNASEQWRGQTALMWAVAQKHPAVARRLIEAGADVQVRSKGGLSPLLFAVRAGDIEASRLLLSAGANVNDKAADGSSALVLAIVNAHYELAATLADRGADVNAPDPRGSALHVLAWMRSPGYVGTASVLPRVQTGALSSLDLAKTLIEHGANVNLQLSWKEREVFEVVSGRVRVPADITVAPTYIAFDGATPFFLAAKHADVALMRLLAEHGANPLTPTRLNVTPLMAAAGLGFWEGESPGTDAEALEAARLAVALGSNVNARADFGTSKVSDWRWSGSTALHGAAIRGSNALVRLLVEHGARLDVTNASGWTPLDVAQGVFVSNTWKVKSETAALLRELMAAPGRAGASRP